jgi:hypothetical protein
LVSALPNSVKAQNKGDFTFEFEVGRQYFAMKQFNDMLRDSSRYDPELKDSISTTTIDQGYRFSYSMHYQPWEFQDIGIYGTYQSGETSHLLLLFFPSGPTMDTLLINYAYKVSSIGGGLRSTFYLNKFLHWEEKASALNRFNVGLELNTGLTYSTFREIEKATDEQYISVYYEPYRYNSLHFQGMVGLKLGVDITRSNFLSGIGVKFGYQFGKSRVLENSNDMTFSSNNNAFRGASMKLDFSGIYGGIYLKLGKR